MGKKSNLKPTPDPAFLSHEWLKYGWSSISLIASYFGPLIAGSCTAAFAQTLRPL